MCFEPPNTESNGRTSNQPPRSEPHPSSEQDDRRRTSGPAPTVNLTVLSGSRLPRPLELIESMLLAVGQPGATCLTQARLSGTAHAGAEDVIVLSPATRRSHIKVVGPTGSGKTEGVLLPIAAADVADGESSVIYVAAKERELEMIAGMCEAAGVTPVLIDIADPERSAGFNRLATSDPARALEEITRLAELSSNPASSDSKFWAQTFATLSLALWKGGFRSFGAQLDVVESGRDALLAVLDSLDDPAARASSAYLRGGSHNADTSLATASGIWNAFRPANIRACTDTHELKGADLFSQRVVILVRVRETLLGTLRGEYASQIMWLLDRAIEAADLLPPARRRPVRVFIEDASSLGVLGIAAAQRALTCRERNIGLVVSFQNTSGLRAVYGAAAAEMICDAFASTVAMPGLSHADAVGVAEATGDQQVLLQIRTPSGTETVQIVHQPLLSAAQVRAPGGRDGQLIGPVTFVLADGLVFQASLTPAHASDALAALAERCRTGTTTIAKRAKPLVPIAPARRPGLGVSTVSGWTDEAIADQLAEVLKRTRLAEASPKVRAWWDAFVAEQHDSNRTALRLAEEIALRGATMSEFVDAVEKSGIRNIQGNIDFMMYRRQVEREKKDADRPNALLRKRRTGDVIGVGEGGHYEFHSYIEPGGTPPAPDERIIELAEGDVVPPVWSARKAAIWVRRRASKSGL